MKKSLIAFGAIAMLAACSSPQPEQVEIEETPVEPAAYSSLLSDTDKQTYTTFKLTTDLSLLSEEDKQIIPLLIEAGEIMDGLFWRESFGEKDSLMALISDPDAQAFALANYGPWDRLNDNQPFLYGVGEKPLGAQYYPTDMTKEEFESLNNPHKTSLYTFIKRDDQGRLIHAYFHEEFSEEVQEAANLLREAAAISTNTSFKFYLEQRAKALETDRYNASDIAWLNLKDNHIDVIIGPIENYEDHLYGYKAAHECYVLVKDLEWSARLDRYKDLLPGLQTELPCNEKYKQDAIGSNAQLNAYDVVFYAGDCNAGSKTIAVNLPNDETIQQQHGTRRSQLKNAMRAKYDMILEPIADELIDESQRQHITFDAFFGNTMFHEVAHGLGIKNTINDNGTVREALKDQASALEEGKADILGLWMVTRLFEMGEIEEGVVEDNYVTFLAGIFRSVRFGASSAHGKANMLRFNYFKDAGAFAYNEASGKYTVNFDAMQEAVSSLSSLILQLQGDGDYDGVTALMNDKGLIGAQLQSDLDKLDEAGIPVDVIFEQGTEALGL
ncbi:MAG: lipoprotein [Flavobacteriales bacterium]|nr:lipoprotein [Flavobacteriales bacterium]MDG1780632.1 lipoprotein [Flavobacteriales bacterium]MDG2244972.1 lipoprotein [Flavobacteriales bacterium]